MFIIIDLFKKYMFICILRVDYFLFKALVSFLCIVCRKKNYFKDRILEGYITNIQIYFEKVDQEGLGVDKRFFSFLWKEEKCLRDLWLFFFFMYFEGQVVNWLFFSDIWRFLGLLGYIWSLFKFLFGFLVFDS